jgi:hypothetical protein
VSDRSGVKTFEIAWSEGPPMPQGRASFAAGLLGDALVAAGGTFWRDGAKVWSDAVDLYDLGSGSWRAGPALPRPLAYGACACSPAGLEVFGGHDGEHASRDTWILSPAGDRWRRSGSLPSERLHGRAETVDGRTYLLGGARAVADFRGAHADVLARDGAGSSRWTAEADLPGGSRLVMATAVVQGRIFVFGGLRATGTGLLHNLADAHSYDPASGRWTRIADLPQGARGVTAAAVEDRWIYLFGGNGASTDEENARAPDHGYLRRVLVYDVESDLYVETTPLPRPAMLLEFFARKRAFYGAGGETMTDTLSYGRSHRLYIGRLSGATPQRGWSESPRRLP